MQMLRLAAGDHDQFPLFVIQLLFIGHFLHHLLPISLELAERPYTSGVKNASSSLVLLSRLNQPELFKLPNRAQHGLPASIIIQAFEGAERFAAGVLGEPTDGPPISIVKQHEDQRLP